LKAGKFPGPGGKKRVNSHSGCPFDQKKIQGRGLSTKPLHWRRKKGKAKKMRCSRDEEGKGEKRKNTRTPRSDYG